MNSAQNHSERSWKLLVLTLYEVSVLRNMTLNDISKTTGIGVGTLKRLFLFKLKPTLPTLFLVACAVGINLFMDTFYNCEILHKGYKLADKKLGSNLTEPNDINELTTNLD